MLAKEARRFNKTQINDKDLLRKLNLLSILGEEILPQDKLDEYG